MDFEKGIDLGEIVYMPDVVIQNRTTKLQTVVEFKNNGPKSGLPLGYLVSLLNISNKIKSVNKKNNFIVITRFKINKLALRVLEKGDVISYSLEETSIEELINSVIKIA